ncbi:MAG: hypothetical protein QOK09_854 [Mycobacterium sp.]|jgi:hypothetical protein|nr:hypothetical protein [Mycobacterium sp.]
MSRSGRAQLSDGYPLMVGNLDWTNSQELSSNPSRWRLILLM